MSATIETQPAIGGDIDPRGWVDPATGELFDTNPYQLPIPELDGHKADVLRINFGGTVEIDLSDPAALDFLNSLRLGRDVNLNVTGRIAGSNWAHALRGEEEVEQVVHQKTVKVHSFDVPGADR